MAKVFKFEIEAVTQKDVAYIVADTREEAQKFIDDTDYSDWAIHQDIISYETFVEKELLKESNAKKGTVFVRLEEVV